MAQPLPLAVAEQKLYEETFMGKWRYPSWMTPYHMSFMGKAERSKEQKKLLTSDKNIAVVRSYQPAYERW